MLRNLRWLSATVGLAVVAACANGGNNNNPAGQGGGDDAGAQADAGGGPSSGGDSGSGADAGTAKDAAVEAEAAPPDDTPVAADARDRFGMVAWKMDPTSKPGATDTLAWSAGKVAALGARTVRVYLGPEDVYGVLGAQSFTTLATAAALPAYDVLFKSPTITTYFVNAFSSYDKANGWQNGMSPNDHVAERGEIATLGAYLLSHYPSKTFVLVDADGDAELAPVSTSDTAWNGYQEWITARAEGVVDARAQVPTTTAKLYSAIEASRLKAADGSPCDTTAHRCVATAIVPKVNVDYYALSAFASMDVTVKEADVPARVKGDLDAFIGFVRQGSPQATRAKIVVGGMGAAREVEGFGECGAMRREAAVLATVLAWGPAYAFHWQIQDDRPTADSGVPLGYGVYKSTGEGGLVEALYKSLYGTQTPTPPAVSQCPGIDHGGIVNGASATLPITPTTVLTIYGSGYASSGNRVQIWQGTERYEVSAGPQWWYESESQINAPLPAGIVPGTARVYVRSGTGVDSNAGVITIVPQ